VSDPYLLYLANKNMFKQRNSLTKYTEKKIKKKEKRINNFGDVCWFFRSFRQLFASSAVDRGFEARSSLFNFFSRYIAE
jgi:hypothetical protein